MVSPGVAGMLKAVVVIVFGFACSTGTGVSSELIKVTLIASIEVTKTRCKIVRNGILKVFAKAYLFTWK